ncbi:MAG: hypothetical protein K0B15_13480 [Lentimicrobium sp.]|nr:hypothetical protein [Lentimicrobium sp.]
MFQQNIAMSPGTEAFSSHLLEVIIMLLGAAILGFIIGWLFRKSYKQEFLAMKADHDPCSGIKAGLEQNINGLNADLEKSRLMISSLTSEKEGLWADLKVKISDIDQAKNSITEKETEIKQLQDQLVSLRASLDKTNVTLKSLEAEKAALHAEINQLHEKLDKTSLGFAAAAQAAVIPDMHIAAQVLGKNYKVNDLKLVEGIGPKIEELFHKAGIHTWAQLAASETSKLKQILDAGGEQFRLHDPSSWPQQAKFAASGLWKELKELQDKMQGGRR